MGKAKLKGKQRLDKFYHLAKEQGYRSRAAFKLLQLDAKFRFLSGARAVLDLCAAPGGWLQVAANASPVGSFILGVDLHPIRPVRNAQSVVEDITTPKCRSVIKRLMDSNGVSAFSVVLHDGSPNVGGAWAQEAASQNSLVIDALRLATEVLSPKGVFVTKIFRSQDYTATIYCLKQLFEKVEVTKPVASRSTSAEIYAIGIKYKAPAKIDPRLLDVKHLFKGAVETPKVVDVLRGSKQKRNREGYEDGNITFRKVGEASDFVWSETPTEFLGSVNVISFDNPSSLAIKDHQLTTEEIRLLCEDLGVLDKHSFKHLLRWRMRIRKALAPSKEVPKVSDSKVDNEGNEDDRLLGEMEELTHALDLKKKREKRRLLKRRAKDKARKATGMQIDATADGYHDTSLFSLSSIKGKELSTLDSIELVDEDGAARDSDEEGYAAASNGESGSEIDSDEEQTRYDAQLEELLNQAYERYVERKGGMSRQQKRAKHSSNNEELLEGGEEGLAVESDHDSDPDRDSKSNPLVVSLTEETELTKDEIMENWFSQDVFGGIVEKETLDKSESDDEQIEKSQKIRTKSEQGVVPSKPSAFLQQDFEIVPADPVGVSEYESSSSSEESEEIDDDEKAEILACARKMLRKKTREQIMDDGYNRYMFNDDPNDLPVWFREEEKRHCQPVKPITKEEVAAMKAQFREINARPAKKVAEAKARKKKAVLKKLEKVRQKATAISDQNDISERSKNKMINQLYKKVTPKKPQKEYVVAKKGVQVRSGKGKVLVDRRMKKDKRTHGMSKAGKGGGKKGGSKKHGKASAKKMKGQQRGKGSSSSRSFGKKGGK